MGVMGVVMSKVEKSIEWIASKSFKNCHAHGVYSVMLDDTPGKVRRAFVARVNHTLWKNAYPNIFSVGYHPHHCDVTLTHSFGHVSNVSPQVRMTYGDFQFYRWESAIVKGGQGRFVLEGEEGFKVDAIYTPLQTTRKMLASEFHTIYVPRYQQAGWFVDEGQEDKGYEPLCLSNDDLLTFDGSNMYQPVSHDEVKWCLKVLGLL